MTTQRLVVPALVLAWPLLGAPPEALVAIQAGSALALALGVVRGGRTLVDGLDLALPQGTITALTGPNGSGKSTLAWCLGLYDLDFTGTVALNGADAGAMSPHDIRRAHRSSIVLQPQDLLLEDSWTVEAVVRHAAWALALPRRERGTRAGQALATVGITHLARTRTGLLSGGERMRVALARTLLVPAPDLVILDEPTAGADDELALLLDSLLDRWVALSAAVLVATHDPGLIERADREVGLAPDL